MTKTTTAAAVRRAAMEDRIVDLYTLMHYGAGMTQSAAARVMHLCTSVSSYWVLTVLPKNPTLMVRCKEAVDGLLHAGAPRDAVVKDIATKYAHVAPAGQKKCPIKRIKVPKSKAKKSKQRLVAGLPAVAAQSSGPDMRTAVARKMFTAANAESFYKWWLTGERRGYIDRLLAELEKGEV